MKAAVITFPGSNCDRDLAVAFEAAGAEVVRVWHKDTALPAGHRYGGHSGRVFVRRLSALRGDCGAARPSGRRCAAHAARGGYVLGICNGFQVLTEMGLLPGVLMRNAGLKFVCRTVALRVGDRRQRLYRGLGGGADDPASRSPITTATTPPMPRRWPRCRPRTAWPSAIPHNPNGAMADIAGVLSANRRVLGLMPHPERVVDAGAGRHGRGGAFPRADRRLSRRPDPVALEARGASAPRLRR